jgi:IrrE N-terminal-like domain
VTWLDNASQDAVDFFWQRAGGEPRNFPRNIEAALLIALPVAVIHLPNLGINNVEHWLRTRRTPYRFGCAERSLRGCLMAFAGKALIFVDGTDAEDERRFTVAHEAAHFLYDYLRPRQQAIAAFGCDIAKVLDGERSPTATERVHALLGSVPIGVHTSLLDRNTNDSQFADTISRTENRADRIALALVAPPQAVVRACDTGGCVFAERAKNMTEQLVNKFGLPYGVAKGYSCSLLTTIGKGRTWADSFR